MLVGMDIGGVGALAAELWLLSDDLRLRYRTVTALRDHAVHPSPVSLTGISRVADDLWAEAADMHRRAVMFEEAEQLALSRLSLSLLLRSWAGPRLDPTEPEPPPLTIAELEAEIARLEDAADPEQLRQLRIMLALVTATEAATRRRDLQEELGRLYPGIPGLEGYAVRRRELEEEILTLLITELQQEKLLLDLETGFSCPPEWEHAERYHEIQVQVAYLEWEMAQRHSTVSLDRIEDLIEGIGEADLHDQMTFVEMVAGDLDAHPDALPIGLMLLADMDEPHQIAVIARIAENGHLEGLFTAVEEFEESLQPQRSSWGPVGDFVGGVWDSAWGSVAGVWGLTLQGVYDWDGWKENWSGVGQSFRLLFESPGDFLYQVADIDTLRENPARWAGGLAPDVAVAVATGGTVTAAAKSGRLGATMSRIASKLDDLTLRVGARLDNLITDPAIRRMIGRLADDTGAIHLGGRPWRLVDVDVDEFLDEIVRRGDLPEDMFTQYDGHLLDTHVDWTDEQMLQRLDDTGLRRTSTFADEATARQVTLQAIEANADEIAEWVADSGLEHDLVLDYRQLDGDDPLGRTVSRTDKLVTDAYDALIVLRKSIDGGWFVLTGYPK